MTSQGYYLIFASWPCFDKNYNSVIGEVYLRYLHTMVRVENIERALSFYCGALGLIEHARNDYPSGRFTLVFLTAAGDVKNAKELRSPLLELTHNWDAEKFDGGRNFGHLAFEVDDIYSSCERLIKNGVTINRPPRDGRMAFVRSPENISIELLQSGDALPATEPWVSMKNKGTW